MADNGNFIPAGAAGISARMDKLPHNYYEMELSWLKDWHIDGAFLFLSKGWEPCRNLG